MSIHHGISCDFCRKTNFSTRRYKCLICKDFDLCANCYENRKHSIDHPMQLMITSNDYEYIYFGNKRTSHSPMSLICPLCNQNGFSVDLLIQHLDEKHLPIIYFVLCPICFIRQNNLAKHLHEHLEIKNKNILNINEKVFSKSDQLSLLENFLPQDSNKNENQQRNFFLHGLLTDVFNQDRQINHST